MKLCRLRIRNFRGVLEGEIHFSGDAVMVGGNSVGKSTICEALDLLLGPDRLSRTSPIDEHDFHRRQYLGDDGNPIPIKLEAVLIDFTADIERKFRSHIEYWNTKTQKLLNETAKPEDTDGKNVVPALRICFEGIYNSEEDEFRAETYFASPPSENLDRRPGIKRKDKREIGFIYLRALRTGARALSLERGSLLDITLRLKDDNRAELWEQTLLSLEHLEPAIHDIAQLKIILEDVEKRVRAFVGLSPKDKPFGLFPTALTRESLRRSITLFAESERSGALVPYWRLGAGVINALVFSLLTFIAELKPNVIFAMEEPELAIPPHTQRRIVRFLREKMDQTILTTHSPFVLEQFPPESVLLLKREPDRRLKSTEMEITGIKAKAYRGGLRRHFAEAILGRGVICVEGVSDAEVLQAASEVLEENAERNEGDYTPLDLSGVTVVHCDGDGGLVRYGEFFANLGLKIYAFYDRQKNKEITEEIEAKFDGCWEIKQVGLERLLSEEVTESDIRGFLDEVSKWDDYPVGENFEYDADANEEEARKVCFRVLRARKGSGYARQLIERCERSDLPEVIVTALEEISVALPSQWPRNIEVDGNASGEGAAL